MSYSVIGVDLGQATDYTAIVVIEPQILTVIRTETIYEEGRERRRPVFRCPDGTETTKHPLVLYHLRHIERLTLGTRYPDVVKRLKELRVKTPNSTLAVDATGVGQPVIDFLESAGLSCQAITITGGDAVTSKGSFLGVPKRDLVSCAQVIFETRRLRIPHRLPLADVLVRELQGFKVRIDPRTAHDSYGAWREGVHDDLVLALCVALWEAGRSCHVPMEITTVEPDGWGSPPSWDAPSWDATSRSKPEWW